MANMMTGTECLVKFPAKVQAEIVKNMADNSLVRTLGIGQFLADEYDSASDFLSRVFLWDKTPEGHDYWEGIYQAI